ncbi:MAG: hypothetical protein ACHQ6U_03070 [Thermodesulfobacteriota bacterium]
MLQASASGNPLHALWNPGKPGDTLVELVSKDPKRVVWVSRTANRDKLNRTEVAALVELVSKDPKQVVWVSRTTNRDKLNRAGVVVPTAAQEAEVKAHLAARAVGRARAWRVNEVRPAAVKASKVVDLVVAVDIVVEEDHVVEAEGVGAVAAGELWY